MHKIDKVLFQVEYILGFGAAVVCNFIGIATSTTTIIIFSTINIAIAIFFFSITSSYHKYYHQRHCYCHHQQHCHLHCNQHHQVIVLTIIINITSAT